MDIITQLFWFLLIISFTLPMFRLRMITSARRRLIDRLGRKRHSRVITLIHRQEQMALFGFPIFRYIDIEDSEQVLRAIRLTPSDMPIDLILHTPGGLALAAGQIALALRSHGAPITVFIPHYAMSGGTIIALAANQLIMDQNAVLGPVDPQIGEYPAASVLTVPERKPIAEIDDKTLIFADVAHKALRQVRALLKSIMMERFDEEKSDEIARILSEGNWTHDYPITVTEARNLGLPISTEVPMEVYNLMDLYPQQVQRRPSVEYTPLPSDQPPRPPQGREGHNRH